MVAGNMAILGASSLSETAGDGRRVGEGWLPPVGRLPLVASWVSVAAGRKDTEGFFAVVGQVLTCGVESLDAQQRQLYPWGQRPVLLAFDGGRVLTRATKDGAPLPLDVASCVDLKRGSFEAYTQADYHQHPTLLWAGCCPMGQAVDQSTPVIVAEQERPVLVLTGAFEDFLNLGVVNVQGFENQEQSVAEVLAALVGGTWRTVRDYAAYGYEGAGEAYRWGSVLAAAGSLVAWHASEGFDARTGQPTFAIRGGWARVTEEGRELFPRTDPAVITAVTAEVEGEEKILLGQARAWGPGRFSTFAGFVEGGEALETAVVREVFEECGGVVSQLRYVGSQPWPFPRSLMCGFIAVLAHAEGVRADGAEIETIRWFGREELRAAHAQGEVQLPGKSSISRRLIETWLGGPLDASGR